MHRILIISLIIWAGTLSAQEKIYLYPSTQKVTNEGFDLDKEPPYIDWFAAKPDSANGSAILICPGGGYGHLADQHEGLEVARFFNKHGFHAFVLHYRLNNAAQQGHRFPDQYNDVTTAMRIIKSKAKETKLDPEKVGIIGFSAGGHLASMCATMHIWANMKSQNPIEHWSSRPAFAILIYPVITMGGEAAHPGSRDNLLGKNPDSALIDLLSTQNRVDAHAPPAFLVYSNDDTVVPPENGILFFQALRQHNIPVSLHIYDHGGHGFGLAAKDPVLNTWPRLCVEWLARMGYRIKK